MILWGSCHRLCRVRISRFTLEILGAVCQTQMHTLIQDRWKWNRPCIPSTGERVLGFAPVGARHYPRRLQKKPQKNVLPRPAAAYVRQSKKKNGKRCKFPEFMFKTTNIIKQDHSARTYPVKQERFSQATPTMYSSR